MDDRKIEKSVYELSKQDFYFDQTQKQMFRFCLPFILLFRLGFFSIKITIVFLLFK